MSANFYCNVLCPKDRSSLCHEGKITNPTKFHCRVWHKVLSNTGLTTVTMAAVPFGKQNIWENYTEWDFFIFLTHHDLNGHMPKILAMWVKEASRAGKQFKSALYAQSALVKYRMLTSWEEKNHNILWEKLSAWNLLQNA